ncbi:putative Melanoma inhibitory activity protein 3 [Hibiscus syriacus]|uniref:Melanoma inhibitory activity protein 3 n=1 Tax=Hibiscus syriacus TaxID=106335 RepID=A0A6A2X9H3_HIBSY|nr:putative Melanoma inhibitory activity protein 3 [Hibiscus syriacus]
MTIVSHYRRYPSLSLIAERIAIGVNPLPTTKLSNIDFRRWRDCKIADAMAFSRRTQKSQFTRRPREHRPRFKRDSESERDKVYPVGLENIGLGLRGILKASAINATVPMVIAVNNRNYGTFKFKNTTGLINYRGDVDATVPIQQSLVPARGKFNISTVANFMVDGLISKATFWADVLTASVNFSSDATVDGKVTMFNALKIRASHMEGSSIAAPF